jgi:hypothetical protein
VTEDEGRQEAVEDSYGPGLGSVERENGSPAPARKRSGCILRIHRTRGDHAHALSSDELKSSEDISLADEREDLLDKKSKRRSREADDRLRRAVGYVSLALTVVSTIIVWILLLIHPSAVPLALWGFGTGGGLALGYRGLKSRSATEQSSDDVGES